MSYADRLHAIRATLPFDHWPRQPDAGAYTAADCAELTRVFEEVLDELIRLGPAAEAWLKVGAIQGGNAPLWYWPGVLRAAERADLLQLYRRIGQAAELDTTIYQPTEVTMLLVSLHWQRPAEEQAEALAAVAALSDEQVEELTRSNKSPEAGRALLSLPVARYEPHLPALLSWLRDTNWPGFDEAQQLLLRAGERVLPAIRQVFREDKNDGTWTGHIIWAVVEQWDLALQRQLTDDLRALVRNADLDGGDQHALEALRPLIQPAEYAELHAYLSGRYADNPYMLKYMPEA